MSLTISPARIVEESNSPLVAAPKSWPRRPLGEVATILNGFAFKSRQFVPSGGKPLIRIRDIFNDRTAVGYIGDYDARYLVEPGELLVGMDGDFNSTRWRGPEALLNQRVCRVTPDPSHLDLDFLTCVLPGYLQVIHDATSSTTVTHLSSRDIAQIPFPAPPLTEQRKLSRLWKAADSKRGNSLGHLASARRAIERFRQSVLAAACSGRLTADWRDGQISIPSITEHEIERLISRRSEGKKRFLIPEVNLHAPDESLPSTWALVPMGLILKSVKYGTSKRSEYGIEGIPVLRIPNISSRSFDLDDLKFAQIDLREKNDLALENGDLLMIRSNGSVELLGTTKLVPETALEMSFAGYLMRLRPDPDAVDSRYLELALSTPSVRTQIEMPARSTSGVHNINTSEVLNLGVALPPRKEQEEIVRRSERLVALAEKLSTRIGMATKHVELSSQAVLAKAFRGEFNLNGEGRRQ